MGIRCGHCGRQYQPIEHIRQCAEMELIRGTIRIRTPTNWYVDGRLIPLPAAERTEEGRAASRFSGPLSTSLTKTKYHDRGVVFEEHVVNAVASCMNKWTPQPAPEWVTWVPSRRNPLLVGDLANQVARHLELPVIESITALGSSRQQKELHESREQFQNVEHAFLAIPTRVEKRPVLLIDDIVRSGWSMTVVGRGLRMAGAPAVFPLSIVTSTTCMRTNSFDP